MKKRLLPILLLCSSTLGLTGCGEEEKPITNQDESTIIKNAKSTDEYLKKQDYKSIAYAYIYYLKEGLRSYESETNGTVKAKVMFFNYDIKYTSITYKLGNTFYSKDDSTSALMNVQNEFYMADKEKIVVSNNLKDYNVYTLSDYHKISYTPNQYTVMGYVFNDQSIVKTQVVEDKGDVVTIEYTLDNELATNLVKVDFKNNGGLSSYPKFKNVRLTLSMKRDFTPVSYSINAVYDAEKPFIGASEVTQESKCLFSNVNQSVTIPNEAFLAGKLGLTPSQVVINDEERAVKDEMLGALKNLDFAKGVNVGGDLTLTLLGTPIVLHLDADVAFDLSRISSDKLYNLLNFRAKLEADEAFSSLSSIILTLAGDKLGEFKDVLKGFKTLEIVYDGDGSFYWVPVSQDGIHPLAMKNKLTDLADLLLKNINVYNLVTGLNQDIASFKKIPGNEKGTYKVQIALNDDIIASFKSSIDKVFENEDYALLKRLLSYKDFGEIKIEVGVANDKMKSLSASLSYLKEGSGDAEDELVTILSLELQANEKTFDYAPHIEEAKQVYEAYESIQSIKSRLDYLLNHVYVNKAYIEELDSAYAEYEALTDLQKEFLPSNIASEVTRIKTDVGNVLSFLETLASYDLNNLNNQSILALARAMRELSLNMSLLRAELGDEKYDKVSDLSSSVDYSIIASVISKLVGEDENAWGLTVDEIKSIHLLFEINAYLSGVSTQVWITLLSGGVTMSIEDFEAKINNLYDSIANQ